VVSGTLGDSGVVELFSSDEDEDQKEVAGKLIGGGGAGSTRGGGTSATRSGIRGEAALGVSPARIQLFVVAVLILLLYVKRANAGSDPRIGGFY
jgi:hypothetical protein